MGALIAKDPFKIDFLYYYAKCNKWLGQGNAIRSTGIHSTYILRTMDKSIDTFIPKTKTEQSKISSLFTHLDSLITLHQRKLLSLKNLKSRLLDRMFCDEKSQFPSIRFKEFTNAWEQWKNWGECSIIIIYELEFTKESKWISLWKSFIIDYFKVLISLNIHSFS
nr:hypothetical protein [Mycoplasmopsis bovis]